ncbi:hypothetical protein DL766_008536 [Monosporascus sp. MC13-8B]|uniref:Ribosome biogenesis protein SLX9 n=1 Tax=Monosporascus cannonballus TaxID=155416 RepID=A0ABY0GU17_9PEZI|nr:hypothetical protein DL762_010340 [Monosporascus cannonballus]RYO80760.1 hypothetical protein DL763_008803 [Monosporascus cannonballus]RYP19091.1 hypothetical protein DL766_008536 [Monosporascus sp. MC13-8B]
MAPVQPTKRRSLRDKLAARAAVTGPAPYEPRKAPRPDAAPTTDAFVNSKKDKRQIKHSSFVSRIEKSGGAGKKAPKRRRPGKKLRTNLEALADALPDLAERTADDEAMLRQLREGRVRHRSLRTRPGALKRKEKIVKGEVERFGVSLARLNAVGGAAEAQGMRVEGPGEGAEASGNGAVEAQTQPQMQAQTQQAQASTANRWAALRDFISATIEQNPAFIGKQDGK